MALSKASELRALSDEEITAEIAKIKRDLFDLRFKKATRQMETGFHEFRHTRRKLAQLMTIENERKRALQLSAKASGKVSTTATATPEDA
ncbi:MAG: LSU ribosomal protein L29 RpmC [Phormidesmis priestleyi Ana]|uniref:Large ribosomal subunit protein uL29 n=1 Tax=Phormidesmis priestleyi Ana TaxID=1666911 RepID=A0A0P7ZYX9_9CYAN|nr:MAG: LSU ribosomal protein L29 RpmC [Phormidesmis priestleyi Ana]